jgi:hypothetical protein
MKSAKSQPKPTVKEPIHLTGVYTYEEAEAATTYSVMTLKRAVQCGALRTIGSGSGVRLLGRDLWNWLRDGARTGRNKGIVEEERAA